jgi:hypothetical protein
MCLRTQSVWRQQDRGRKNEVSSRGRRAGRGRGCQSKRRRGKHAAQRDGGQPARAELGHS